MDEYKSILAQKIASKAEESINSAKTVESLVSWSITETRLDELDLDSFLAYHVRSKELYLLMELYNSSFGEDNFARQTQTRFKELGEHIKENEKIFHDIFHMFLKK
jgi:hypothetical protein